ncbi:MAG TPA: EamA family transporter [Leptolyngbyaceae cyanobacterium M65_K2018_010]|nr:EamA family transporter [Leptolyngbyaceae cyanobacterium M65_K2018_010]
MVSTQLGSAIAKSLFNQVGPLGMVSLRVGLAAILLILWQRPRWRGHTALDYRLLVAFGLSLAVMNGCFYAAIARIPIGVAVALEFSGPLLVSLLYSRRWLDGLWVGLAAIGVVLLSPLQGASLDSLGVVLALLGGVAWGFYIILSAWVGRVFQGGEGLALAMAVGGLLLLPLGLATTGPTLFSPSLLGLGLAVALLASALPYSLEMVALRRMPVHGFGVLLSLEPAIASVISWLGLGETLTLQMMVAIGLIMMAAAGVSLGQPQVVSRQE